MYLLTGPRRVGKSVEVKRAISALISSGVDARRIVHASCDGMLDSDLRVLLDVIDRLSGGREAPRYVFLDEITAIGGDWVSRVKWLRDNSSLRDDCLVLTGSSSEQLMTARKRLAGRRGEEARSVRTLLPISFRGFCRATAVEAPDPAVIHARDLLDDAADRAIDELSVYTDALVAAWEEYLKVGGFPRAVAGWIRDREIPASFVEDIWEVVHGDALSAQGWSEGQSRVLVERLGRGLGSPLSIERLTREVQNSTRDAITTRLRRLEHTFTIWSCPRGDSNTVNLRAQQKVYFVDPLLTRMVALRGPGKEPDPTQLSEQQLGMALLRQYESGNPGRFTAQDALRYQRSATGREIDFVGPWLGGVPIESKYSDGPWLRATQTARAAYDGRAVLATRGTTARTDDARALPAATLAYLIDA